MCKLAFTVAVLMNVVSLAAQREEGPFYEVRYALAGPAVQVRKMWGVTWGTKESFVVPVTLSDSPAMGKEGEVHFGRPWRTLDDGWSTWSRVAPVRHTELAVQVQEDYQRRITISVLDHAGRESRKLASFPQEPQNPDDGACAVTRSGRYVLLVLPDKITIWDVPKWRADAELGAASGLPAIRAEMVKVFGNAGNWWLTDDLRYVVADSTHWVWRKLSMVGRSTPAPLMAAGVKMDLVKDAIVFDRKAGTLTTFRSEIPELGNLTIADVEDVGGQIALLYKLGPILDLRLAVADTAGHVRASHSVKTYVGDLAGWDPEHDTVWVWHRDANTPLRDVRPESDDHLIAWDVGKNSERRYRIPIADIRRAVDGAK